MDNHAGSDFDAKEWRGFVKWGMDSLSLEDQAEVLQMVAWKGKDWPL